jgi:hypothetical protein
MKAKNFLVRVGLVLVAAVIFGAVGDLITRSDANAANGTYKILAWNDLGMHCYNRDFSDLAVLPPYNNLWVQVVKAGDPPTLVTTGITVEYFYEDNTYSVGKTNFWSYSQPLFGVTLAPNVGLKGKGLSGTMDFSVDHFVAEGIPVTEYSDSAPTTSQPYQLATVVVKDSNTSVELARTQVVTPVSSEMRCDKCHSNTGEAKPDHPTGKVETNILQLHDEEEGTSLMANRPVLCAKCHSSNALGAPGEPGLPSLSNAMHEKHDGESPNTLNGCYNCHPGPQTRCLRDTMSARGMTCIGCHGGMSVVKNNPNPWLNEPRCDTCHNSGQYNQNHALYRFSTEHGGLYCEACHDSTHAVAPSREANDAIKFVELQGKNGPIDECQVCHITALTSETGPHGIKSVTLTVLSITRLGPMPTNAASVDFTVTFSKYATGVDIVAPFDDFALTTSPGISGASVTNVSGSGTTYTVTVNTGSGNGTIRLDVPATGVTIYDLVGNPISGLPFTDGETYIKYEPQYLTFTSTGARDGWVLESTETSGHGGSINATATTLRLGDNTAKKQYRSILSFTTGDLPDDAVITKVTLKVKKQGIIGGGNPVTAFQGFMADIKKGYFGASALQTADFQTAASKTYGPFKPALSSGWYSIDLTGGKNYINKLSSSAGLTQIRLRFKLDDNNNATANYLSLYSGNAGSSARPQLIIEYYVP